MYLLLDDEVHDLVGGRSAARHVGGVRFPTRPRTLPCCLVRKGPTFSTSASMIHDPGDHRVRRGPFDPYARTALADKREEDPQRNASAKSKKPQVRLATYLTGPALMGAVLSRND
jgi:hypothetical protein